MYYRRPSWTDKGEDETPAPKPSNP